MLVAHSKTLVIIVMLVDSCAAIQAMGEPNVYPQHRDH